MFKIGSAKSNHNQFASIGIYAQAFRGFEITVGEKARTVRKWSWLRKQCKDEVYKRLSLTPRMSDVDYDEYGRDDVSDDEGVCVEAKVKLAKCQDMARAKRWAASLSREGMTDWLAQPSMAKIEKAFETRPDTVAALQMHMQASQLM